MSRPTRDSPPTPDEGSVNFKADPSHHEDSRHVFVDDKEVLGHDEEYDDAVQAVKGQDLEYTAEEGRRVLRKIDWHILPIGALACSMQFVDKSALGAGATYGLRQDLGFVGSDYSWCVAGFYIGYIVGAPIQGVFLQRYHAGKVMAVNHVLWGISLLGMLAVKNYAATLALRILLGLFEASLVPGLLLVTTMWYDHAEQPLRFGVWTCFNGVAPIPFLLVYWGLGHVTNGPLAPWRLIFLVVGLVSVAVGVLLWFYMPDSPIHAKWLNERERAIAIQRINKAQTGVKNSTFKWSQAREAFTDWRVWLLVLMMFFSQAGGSVTTNFLGIVIKDLGYTALKAQLYTTPNFAVHAVSQLLVSMPPTLFPAFRNAKLPLAVAGSTIGVIGMAILYATPALPSTRTLRLAGCILISASAPNYTVIMSVIGCNVGGFTKKQVTSSMAFVAYSIINIITPQTFLTRESPRYRTGISFVMSCMSIYIVLAMITWSTMMLENRRRDRLAKTDPAYATGADNLDVLSGLKDLTERENMHARYSG